MAKKTSPPTNNNPETEESYGKLRRFNLIMGFYISSREFLCFW